MKTLTGINIQYPISRLILSGEKTIETRTYPIPSQYIGKEMAIIETPGKSGKFSARIVGTITFSGCFQYPNKSKFYEDKTRHHVSADSPWRWQNSKPKWGWEISAIKIFKKPIPPPNKRGIVYTKEVSI